MKRIVITGQWLDTLPLPHTRPYMVDKIFELAKANHWAICLPREHWDR